MSRLFPNMVDDDFEIYCTYFEEPVDMRSCWCYKTCEDCIKKKEGS